MNLATDLLRTMHLTGGVFLEARFTAPWCITAGVGPEDCAAFMPAPQSVIAFHYVSSGRLLLQVPGDPPLSVEAGEIVLLPHNDVHRMGSELGRTPPVNADQLIQPGEDGRLARIEHGGAGEATEVLCGFLGTDKPGDPVLLMLPRVLRLKIEDATSIAWIESTFRFASREIVAGMARTPDTLVRLAELLFTDTVRRYLDTLPLTRESDNAGMLDARIARALGLLHNRLQKRWTTEELAREVGMSRSAFAELFSQILAEPPMHYLARQRLCAASRRLQETSDSLARIAFDIGYESEAAFSRAFKREFGMPPASWRNDRQKAATPD